jgi:HlyD family secretion protein
MKRWGLILFLIALGAGAVLLATRRAAPAEVPFAKVKRETLVSTLTTNGKVEPLEWIAVRAEREGMVASVPVARGSKVQADATIVTLVSRDAQTDLASAEARLSAAQAEMANVEHGGRGAELAEIDGSLAKFRADAAKLTKDLEATRRLVEKQAAPAADAADLESRLNVTNVQISALAAKRKALVSEGDRSVASARLKDAQTAVDQARRRMDLAVIRSPQAGVVYNLPVRAGAYVHAGDLVAEVGRLDRLRVSVYVDEPELGRVKNGLPVILSWDGRPGREWKAVIEQVPTQVTSLGTRQVGEVITVAENPDLDLPPGANVTAQIRAQVVDHALTIPRDCLRRQETDFGVYLLAGSKLEWRLVKVGASSETRAQAISGLAEGDAVALPTERILRSGMDVSPVFR